MPHEFKHGYQFNIRKMPDAPTAADDIPYVEIEYAGETLVKEGDAVYIGTPLCDRDGFRIPSPVSGEVTLIGEKIIHIENNMKYERDSSIRSFGTATGKTISELTFEDARDYIRSCGIVEGGSKRPTFELMESYVGKTYKLIVNAVRCESADMSEAAYAVFAPEKLIGGMKILMKALGIKQGAVMLSSCDRANCRELVELAAKNPMTKILTTSPKYPQSDPHLIVYAVSGRELSPLFEPTRAGCAIFSAKSAAQIYDAFAAGSLSGREFVSFGSDQEVSLLDLPSGAPLSYIRRKFDLQYTAFEKNVWSGIKPDANYAVQPGTDTVYFSDVEENRKNTEFGCNKCGECISVCPMYLFPFEFAYVGHRRALKAGVRACIECGLCEYICPAELPLMNMIRKTKTALEAGKEGTDSEN